MNFIITGIAGSLGARYLIYLYERSLPSDNYPYATLFINLTGCFLAGIILGISEDLSPSLKYYLTLISLGFIGSFTTFSTFAVETLNLILLNQFIQAFLNIILNVILGISLVWIGKTIIS